LRSQDQPLARQCFVLFFDQIRLALSDLVALYRLGSEFVGDLIALPALCEKSIHDPSPDISGPWSWVEHHGPSANAAGVNNVRVNEGCDAFHRLAHSSGLFRTIQVCE
jgi:hypothetical protein